MILDVHREMLLPRLERHAFRHRPAREGAVPLQPEVVVEPAGVVALDDEDGQVIAGAFRAEGLRGPLRVSLAAVVAQ
jgi:hypothetical protein